MAFIDGQESTLEGGFGGKIWKGGWREVGGK